ncbi:uncharacterized protein YfaS (alpha-2-macroglobulin family) [Actinoplanes tereljensis]|uniref:Uncharacterized protein n=1 Tax=Paractinoplanes tereljensis TaxID=571912 RepID=A0A919NLU2_9ACTN|nr:hypothetical protein [Actinoplanes tereljensis]GIF20873.1 hypothetical protein Ate02nite_36030 [Actinoplanes tereljensis]
MVVSRKSTAVRLDLDRKNYAYGDTARATIRVEHTSGTVCLAGNLGQSTCTETNRAGVAHLTYDPMEQNTIFTASFAGNGTYAPASTRVSVTTSAQLQESLRGRTFTVVVQPYRPGAKVQFTTQALVRGKWNTVATRTVRLDGNSQAGTTVTGPAGTNRIRASFIADSTNTAADGAWLSFTVNR